MVALKAAFEQFASCLIYALVIALIDFTVIVIWQGLDQVVFSLPFVMLAEGGIGLTIGGATASFSTLAGKVEEAILHSKPWDAKRQKDAEKQARIWILTGSILVLCGLLVSAL